MQGFTYNDPLFVASFWTVAVSSALFLILAMVYLAVIDKEKKERVLRWTLLALFTGATASMVWSGMEAAKRDTALASYKTAVVDHVKNAGGFDTATVAGAVSVEPEAVNKIDVTAGEAAGSCYAIMPIVSTDQVQFSCTPGDTALPDAKKGIIAEWEATQDALRAEAKADKAEDKK